MIAQAQAGGTRFVVETDSPVIAAGDPFAFTVAARVPRRADSVTVLFRLRHPAGRLIFQRTRVINDPAGATVSETFERETADLSLRPGAYPLTVDATVRTGDRTETVVLEGTLLVTAPGASAVPVVLAARVFGQPLADPQGRFVSDPGMFTRARDEISTLSAWVLSDTRARVTLAVPPLLLEEWARIADGYELAGPEGVETFEASSTVALEYARALSTLREAMETDRLELVSTGYADPNLFELAAAGLTRDTLAHYERGRSAVFSSLETSPSTGTVPAGGCMPDEAVAMLEDAGVEYALLDSACLKSGSATAKPGSYRIADSTLVAIAADPEASRALASGDASALVAVAFDRVIAEERAPLAAIVELGPGAQSAEQFIAVATALRPYRFMSQRVGREAAGRPRNVAELTTGDARSTAPRGYWSEVADARLGAGALLAAVGESAVEAVAAERDSLIAASSAWAGTDGAWTLADRGRGFADNARRLADEILSGVSVSVESVTLAGNSGDVPLTIRNNSDRVLQVRLVAQAPGGGGIDGSTETSLTLEPQDTFVQIPVDLSNAVVGEVRVALFAGDVELDAKTVSIRASYLDRIAIIAGVVVIMIGFLVFIARRVRAQEPLRDAEAAPERYTGNVMHEGAPTRARDYSHRGRGSS